MKDEKVIEISDNKLPKEENCVIYNGDDDLSKIGGHSLSEMLKNLVENDETLHESFLRIISERIYRKTKYEI